MPPDSRESAPTRLEVTGSLTLQRLGKNSRTVGDENAVMRIDLSTGDDHTIFVDLSQPPPIKRIGPLTKRLWGSRAGLATWLIKVNQPVRVRVAGKTWLSIDIAPSRLGRFLNMPGLTLHVAIASLLTQRFRKTRPGK